MNRDIRDWSNEIEALRESGCGRNIYLYYTKGYLCNGSVFLCPECFFKIQTLSDEIRKTLDSLQEKKE